MIYTGYFAKLKTYENAGLIPVSIAGKAPNFYKGVQYKGLAPRWEMFNDWKKGKIDDMQYTSIFLQHLETLDKEAVRRALENFGENVILLCYEKPGDFCHRHIVADWLESNFGWRVDEYDQIKQDRKAQVIKDLKSFYLNKEIIEHDYQIEDADRFIQELEENPPEGYFLYKKIRNNVIEYTLEDSQEFLKEYGL
jgi:hypothetical protein